MGNRINKKLNFESLEQRIVLSANYFISTTGSDANPGTFASAFATMQKAVDVSSAGDTISMLAGTYTPHSSTLFRGKVGTAQAPIRLEAYQGGEVIIDGANIPFDPSNNAYGIRIARLGGHTESSYIEIDGLRLTNMPNGGISVYNSNHITITNGETDHNGRGAAWAASGITVGSGTSYVSIENWDSHHNANELGAIYDNADGFVLNASGQENRIINSRAWRNSDDGIDLFFATEAVTMTGNWVYENGYLDEDGLPATTSSGPSAGNPGFSGDGNGIKMGGGTSASEAANANHHISNNVVWGNRVGGIADNSNDGPLTVYNNTSYNNGSYDFSFWDNDPTYTAKVRNNLSLSTIGVMNGADDQFNSWNYPGLSITSSDFVTLDDTANRAPRQADGSLPASNFLHLAAGSNTINAGVDVGLPFDGAAPDLGAFEWSVVPSSADFDDDGDVDGADFLSWQRGFGTPAPIAIKSDGDANNDQAVDGEDLAVWTVQFGNPPPSSAALSTNVFVPLLAASEATPETSVLSISVLAMQMQSNLFSQGQLSQEQEIQAVYDDENSLLYIVPLLPQVTFSFESISIPSGGDDVLGKSPKREFSAIEAAFEEISSDLKGVPSNWSSIR